MNLTFLAVCLVRAIVDELVEIGDEEVVVWLLVDGCRSRCWMVVVKERWKKWEGRLFVLLWR